MYISPYGHIAFNTAQLRLLDLDTVLLCVLILAGLAAAALVSAGLIAFSRRQSRSYLLIVLALGTLICKACVGGFTLFGILPSDLHHLVEPASI